MFGFELLHDGSPRIEGLDFASVIGYFPHLTDSCLLLTLSTCLPFPLFMLRLMLVKQSRII